MKIGFATLLFFLVAALNSPVLLAANSSGLRAEADQFYLEGNYKKAYKSYFKLAKTGDHFSQGRVASMYANGDGTSVNLTQAYAWSVLAEEGGESFVESSSSELLQRADDPSKAEKKALKLKSRYGQKALRDKELKRAEAEAARRSGSSMGSNLSR
jgi:TPR repeat protein